ncbi:hypothetical protein ACLQ8T_15880 [Glutamicibacter sp. FR1]|uniref:hypothetical protein n=1 Tax=Glutamicibacter sp. FR1 TaxID=3393744 RepID=UPI0039B0A8AF
MADAEDLGIAGPPHQRPHGVLLRPRTGRLDENYYTAEQITEESYWGHSHEGAEPLAAFEVPSASGAAS